MKGVFLLCSLLALCLLAESHKAKNRYNDWIAITPKTPGKPWPQPQTMLTGTHQFRLEPRAFSFQYSPGSQICELLTGTFNRYYKIIFSPLEYEIIANKRLVKKLNKFRKPLNGVDTDKFTDFPVLKRLVVTIANPCEDYPSLDSDESYLLQVQNDFATLSANTLWGVLRGIETFSQLVFESDGSLIINETSIIDYPRFQHRGLLLDTSRHFIDKEILKINLEAMAANKMNVFHWHIVDDQSFPYQSTTFPDLSILGSFDPYTHVYSQEDVKEIIEFARQRGIRVVPEFDSPGHTLSWGSAVPILTPCYSSQKPDGSFGPIDPTNVATYAFLKTFVKELIDVFPDKYLHLGGDEVDYGCWQSNPDITKFMQQMGFGNDYAKLEQFYEQNLLDIIQDTSNTTGYIIWQEVVDNNVKVKPDTVVEVWRSPYQDEMAKVTQLGYRTLLSSCWYLDYISYGPDWATYYKCDPYNFNGTDAQKKLVIGGEACLWGEYVDGTNVISRAWPRASAVAERLWSAQSVNDPQEALGRLEEQRCRMIKRGIHAEPMNGPGFCDYEAKLFD